MSQSHMSSKQSKYRSGAVRKNNESPSKSTYTYTSSGSRTDSDDDTRTNGRTMSSLSGTISRKPSPYKDPAHVSSLNKAQLLKKAKGNAALNRDTGGRLPVRKAPQEYLSKQSVTFEREMRGPDHHHVNAKIMRKLDEYQSWQNSEGAPSKDDMFEQLYQGIRPYTEYITKTRSQNPDALYIDFDRKEQRRMLQELLVGHELLESTSNVKRELIQLGRETLQREVEHGNYNPSRGNR